MREPRRLSGEDFVLWGSDSLNYTGDYSAIDLIAPFCCDLAIDARPGRASSYTRGFDTLLADRLEREVRKGAAMPEFDAIIIGTGQAGPSLARRLAAVDKRVAIIERKRFGGTCVNTGCTPTKTMVASAYAARLANRAAEYGVLIDGRVTVDMKRVKARKDAVAGQSEKAVERSLRSLDLCSVYTGHARFVSPQAVAVGDEVLRADWIFVNVGGRALVPDMPGLDQVEYLTNSSILELDALPPHLVIIGGSYVGLEFGQVFRRFGSQVTIIEMAPRLIAREDEDTSAAIARYFAE